MMPLPPHQRPPRRPKTLFLCCVIHERCWSSAWVSWRRVPALAQRLSLKRSPVPSATPTMNSPTTSSGTGSNRPKVSRHRGSHSCAMPIWNWTSVSRRLPVVWLTWPATLSGAPNFATCLSCSVRRCRLKTTPSDLKRSPVGCGRSAMPAAPRSIDRWSCSIAWNNCWRQSCRRSTTN